MAKRAVQKAIELAVTQWENVNTRELVRAVAITTSRAEIERLQLSEVVPVPKGTTTLKSFVESRKTAKKNSR